MNTSLIIGMTNTSGENKQKSITDVSNTATNAQLVAFAQGLVAVTNNTYKDTTKVTKVDCDNEADKPVPSLKFQLNVWDDTQGKTVQTMYDQNSLPQPLVFDTRALQTYSGVKCFDMNIFQSGKIQLSARQCVPRLLSPTTTASTPVEPKSQHVGFTYGYVSMGYSCGEEAATITGTLHIDGDDNFAAVDFPMTIQIVPGGE